LGDASAVIGHFAVLEFKVAAAIGAATDRKMRHISAATSREATHRAHGCLLNVIRVT
jgi:hypothetical protein